MHAEYKFGQRRFLAAILFKGENALK